MGVHSRPAFSASIAKKPPQSTIAVSELSMSEAAAPPLAYFAPLRTQGRKMSVMGAGLLGV